MQIYKLMFLDSRENITKLNEENSKDECNNEKNLIIVYKCQ